MHTFFADFQWKVLDRIIGILQNDPYLLSKVNRRVSPQHLSNIDNPTYPLITVMRQGLGADPGIGQIDNAFLVIDVWSRKSQGELWEIYSNRDPITQRPAGVRALLSDTGFDFPEAIVDICREVYVADNLYEAWNKTFHLSARFDLRYVAKSLDV